jgi:hypothetical protein
MRKAELSVAGVIKSMFGMVGKATRDEVGERAWEAVGRKFIKSFWMAGKQ